MRTRARTNGQDPYGRVLADLRHAKATAQSNDAATKCDKALAQLVTAANHAKFINKFMGLADAEQQLAATFAGSGRERLAQEAIQRANQYARIAQNHAQAAEDCQRKGEELARS